MHDSSKDGLIRAYKIIRAAIEREKDRPSSADIIIDLGNTLNHLNKVLSTIVDISQLTPKRRGRKSSGISTAHNSNPSPNGVSTINSSTPKPSIDTVRDMYRDACYNRELFGLWESFLTAYNRLTESEQDIIYPMLCVISESTPPWGFTPIQDGSK